MTDDLGRDLLALATQWEVEARSSDDDEYSDRSDAYRDCADAVRRLVEAGSRTSTGGT